MAYYLTTKEYNNLYAEAHKNIRESLRCKLFVRNPTTRDWLAKSVCDAIKVECTVFTDPGLSSVRSSLADRVAVRVTESNQVPRGDSTFGFVILPIILASVLSWLIQKLLNYIFPNV